MRFATTALVAFIGTAVAVPVILQRDITDETISVPAAPKYHTDVAAWKREPEAEKNCTGASCFELWKRKQLLPPIHPTNLADGVVETREAVEQTETVPEDPKTLILWKKEADADAEPCTGPKCYELWKKDAAAEAEPEAKYELWKKDAEAEAEPCTGPKCYELWKKEADAEANAEPAWAW